MRGAGTAAAASAAGRRRAGAAAAGPAAAAACTSAFTMRPPGPVPRTESSATPSSRAIRRANGEALTRSPVSAAAGAPVAYATKPSGACAWRVTGPPGGVAAAAGAGAAAVWGAEEAADSPLAVAADPPAAGAAADSPAAPFPAAASDARDHRADRQRVTLRRHDLKRPRHVGLVGHRGLVGLDLHELLATADLLAVALQPLQDRALLHRVGEARHHDVGHAVPGSSGGWAD